MKDLLHKILAGRMSWGRTVLAAAGFVVGLVTVLLAAQTYTKFRHALNPSRDFHEYLVISKEVHLGGNLFGPGATFTDGDIDRIREQPFVQSLGIFGSSRFDIFASAGGDLGLETEMFFESVPDEFLDIVPEGWDWQDEKDPVPILLSQEFLHLYNFGYAISRGYPQLSAATIEALPLELTLSGSRKARVLPARIVGFSHRIGSILVPDSFLDWANLNFGRPSKKGPSKLIVHVDQRRNAEVRAFLADNELRVNPDRLNSGKAVMILNIATSIVLGVGLFFVVLATTILVLNFAILVSDARDELQLLIQLGYSTRILFGHLSRRLIGFVAAITLASAVGFLILWNVIASELTARGLSVSSRIDTWVALLGLAFVLITVVITGLHTRRLIARL